MCVNDAPAGGRTLSHSGFRSAASMDPAGIAGPPKYLIPSPVGELDALAAARVRPPDRLVPERVAHDTARPALDAPLDVVPELPILPPVDLGGAHGEARLQRARRALLRLDDDERLLVRLELVEPEPVVCREVLLDRGRLLPGSGHRPRHPAPSI